MIRFKDDARPTGIWHSRELRRAFPIVEEVWHSFGQVDVWVTCGPEGEHSPGSCHGCGDAVDLRSRFFSDEQKERIASEVRAKLATEYPRQFDFVLEGDHFHLEYDPK